jgi:hypothetical protein
MIIKQTKIKSGVWKIEDTKGNWIARGGEACENGQWQAFDAETLDECNDKTNWAVQFPTKKQLINFAKSFE